MSPAIAKRISKLSFGPEREARPHPVCWIRTLESTQSRADGRVIKIILWQQPFLTEAVKRKWQ